MDYLSSFSDLLNAILHVPVSFGCVEVPPSYLLHMYLLHAQNFKNAPLWLLFGFVKAINTAFMRCSSWPWPMTQFPTCTTEVLRLPNPT